jgi:hypothetical protein
MPHDRADVFNERLTRRTLVKRAGAGAAAVLGGSLYATGPAAARDRVHVPIDHGVAARDCGRSEGDERSSDRRPNGSFGGRQCVLLPVV